MDNIAKGNVKQFSIGMPVFSLKTNVEQAKITEALVHELSTAVAEMLGKPISYVAVVIEGGMTLAFNDDATTPAGVAVLKSIGGIGYGFNDKHSKVLFPILNKHLGIPGNRLYIEYFDVPGTYFAHNGLTFA